MMSYNGWGFPMTPIKREEIQRIRNTAKYDSGGILGDTIKKCANRIEELENENEQLRKNKVWAVIAEDYGTSSSSIVHICETEEIANSFREYEHRTDYAGPVYKVKQLTVESQLAELPEDRW